MERVTLRKAVKSHAFAGSTVMFFQHSCCDFITALDGNFTFSADEDNQKLLSSYGFPELHGKCVGSRGSALDPARGAYSWI